MASTTTPTGASTVGPASGPATESLPTDAISYTDLYTRWERGNWSAICNCRTRVASPS